MRASEKYKKMQANPQTNPNFPDRGRNKSNWPWLVGWLVSGRLARPWLTGPAQAGWPRPSWLAPPWLAWPRPGWLGWLGPALAGLAPP